MCTIKLAKDKEMPAICGFKAARAGLILENVKVYGFYFRTDFRRVKMRNMITRETQKQMSNGKDTTF